MIEDRIRDVETKLAVVERTLQEREKALNVALIAMDKRLETMNEFRDQLRQQAANFISRADHEIVVQQIGSWAARISGLEAKIYIGGAGILVVMTALQLIVNYLHR